MDFFPPGIFLNTLGSREYFFLIDTDGSRQRGAKRLQKKKSLVTAATSLISGKFRIIYVIKPVWSWCACLFSLTLTAEIWSYVTLCNAWKKNCAKANEERKVLLKIVTNSFPKKYTSSFKYMKRTEVSWGVHTLYVFKSQKDKENFRSATLVLLYEVKLNIARQNEYAKQNIILLHFLANKPRHELSGIRKKKKNLLHPGYYPWECKTEPSKTKHSRKSSHSFKVRPLIGKIQTMLLPRATLIQLSDVRSTYYEV